MSNDQRIPKHKSPMTNHGSDKPEQRYDHEERTALFGEAIIAFAKRIPKNVVTIPSIDQDRHV
jgi:hypothetical protein